MRRLVLAALALGGAAPAQGEVLIYVCGVDLCRLEDGRSSRLTRDGSAERPYARPALSARGRRLVFKQGRFAYAARLGARGIAGRHRVGPGPGGAPDATAFDVAISRDGRRVAWVELRINVVFDSIDYRRYAARFDGGGSEQVASNGGRPFVAFFDDRQILREGVTDAFARRADFATVDQGLCVPDPATETNGVCGIQAAYEPAGRHLRHPSVAGRRVVATAFAAPRTPDAVADGRGDIVLFDAATAAPVRTLADGGAAATFAPDGRSVLFDRGGWIMRVATQGGRPRRVVRGTQPALGR